nr:pseudouridine synthase [uncultured Cohaesibacter sp.]
MERKSAQKGRRSADARSPDASKHARRDGAHHSPKSGSFKKKGPGTKNKPNAKPFGRDRKDDGWSPSVDARREKPEERALRQPGDSKTEARSGERRFDDRKEGRGFDKGPRFAKGPRDDRGPRSDKGRGRPDRPVKDRPFKDRPFKDRPAAQADKPKGPAYTPPTRALEEGERIAKIMARAGLCSRRDAENWIKAGRVSVNGKVLDSPAINIHTTDTVLVDGAPLPVRERTRLWLYHKPRGLVTTTSDPEGRPTVFEKLPVGLPRVITIGRLDINTEGLLLLTNDGGLARVLELPTTGWLRRYRVRAYGKITQAQLDTLAEGVALEGVLYGSIDAQIEREVGDNVWITVALREGKNREVKKVLGHLGLEVNRLIRVSYGPFQLLDMKEGTASEVKSRVLRDQLGERLVEESGADFDAPILTEAPKQEEPKPEKKDRKSSGGARAGFMSAKQGARAFSETKDGKRGDRSDRGDRGDRPDRGDRGERGGRGFGRDRDDRGDRPDRGGRGDRSDRPSYNAIPYAERKPFDPAAPRRTSFTYREEGADGKKSVGKSVRKVGGRPQKADLLDPNARIEKRKPTGKPTGRPTGKPTGRPSGKFGNKGDRSFEGRDGGRDGGRPSGGRPGGRDGGRPSGGRPSGGRPSGGRPSGKFGGKPGGPRGRD